MEKDNLNARFPAGADFHAGEVGKPGMKLNILGIEITPDDSPIRGATNWTGISGKTMLEQMSHHPGVWAVGGAEDITGGGTGGSEDNHGQQNDPEGNAGKNYRAGGQEPDEAQSDAPGNWTAQQGNAAAEQGGQEDEQT